MVSALGYLCCLGSVLAAVAKVRSTHGTPMTASRRYLVGAMVTFGMALAVSAPATLKLAAPFEQIPNGTRLLANALAMFSAFCVLGVLDHAISANGRRRSLAYAGVLVASVTAMTVLLAAADTQYHAEFASTYGDRPPIIAYMCIYLGYMSFSLGRFAWLMRRYASARAVHPVVRRCFAKTVFSAHIGLVWVAWKIAGLVVAITGAPLPAQAAVAQLLAVVAVGVGAAGSTYTSWAPVVRNLPRLLRVSMARQRLRWLWRQMIGAVPHVEFGSDDVSTAGTTLTRSERAEYRLYRRTLEIRDAELALRTFIPSPVPAWALETARTKGLDPVSADVLLEAAELGTALDAQRAGRRRASEADLVVPHHGPAQPDLMEEAAWLIRVATAVRRSELVARLRERAAHDRVQYDRHARRCPT